MASLAMKAGRPLARALLLPVCGYFFLTAPSVRRASADYLGRVFERTATPIEVYRHIHTFAVSILDRVYFRAGQLERFEIRLSGEAHIAEALAAQRGLVLLGSHFGSFDLLRVVGMRAGIGDIQMAMYRAVPQKVDSAIAALGTDIPNVIALDQPGAMLKVKESLERGSVVGFLADRAFGSARLRRARFLGSDALFPQGPLHIAKLLQVPIVMAFACYQGKNRYAIHFEKLEPADVERYAERLEHYCRLAPYNWFNFYDFWQTEHVD